MKSLSIAFVIFTLALLGFSTYQALVVAPTEQTMGEVQRIFYYHVPSAWVAGLCFAVNFLASVVSLWKRSLNADAGAGRGRGVFLPYRIDYRADMGPSGVGHMVDLGRPPHHNPCALADLRQLPGAAAGCRPRG